MKIAIDISPLQSSGHKGRGGGRYIELLRDNLEKFDTSNSYLFFKNSNEIKNDFDIVHYPYFDPFFLSLPVFKNKPTIVTVHDLIPLLFPNEFPIGIKGKLKWQVQKLALKNSSSIITDSDVSKSDISRLTKIKENKIERVYLAVSDSFKAIKFNQKEREEILGKYNIPDKFLLYVGDVNWNKNLPNIIKAVKETSATLVLVGKSIGNEKFDTSNGWNRDLVEVNKLTQSDNKFIKLGFVDENSLIKLYNMAEALVAPSYYEGFGFTILEAMKCGCPVVTSSRGSLREVAGEACLLVNPENVSEIKEAILEVTGKSDIAGKISKLQLVQAQKFDIKETILKTIEVYKKVYNARK